MTGIGPVAARVPRVRDPRRRRLRAHPFSSAIRSYARRAKSLSGWIPIYLRASRPRLSRTRWIALLGRDAGGSRPRHWTLKAAGPKTRGLEQARSLGQTYIYFWSTHSHSPSRRHRAMPADHHRSTPEGRRTRRPHRRWAEVPNLGETAPRSERGVGCRWPRARGRRWRARVWQALEKVCPQNARPVCWCTKPPTSSTNCRRASNRKPSGRCRKSGWPRPRRMRLRLRRVRRDLGVKYDKAVRVPDKIATRCSPLRLPAEHWKHLRTTNVIESCSRHGAHAPCAPRMSLKQDSARHDLQTQPSCRKSGVASMPQPVAENLSV